MLYTPLPREATSSQYPIPEAQMSALCERAFGAVDRVRTVTEVGGGMFNNSFHITLQEGARLVLRVAPHPDVRPFYNERQLMRREYGIQPWFAGIGEVIPRAVLADFSHELLPRDYVVQNYIPGELWDAVKEGLTPEESDGLWRQLGQLVRRIHGVHGESFGFPDPLPRDVTWSAAIQDIAEGMVADLFDLHIDPANAKDYVELLSAGAARLDEVAIPVLVHGDIWPKNVLIERHPDEGPRITGLLDAERALFGDPLAEWVYYFLPIPPAYWEGYGGQPEGEGVRFRAAACQGLYCVQSLLECWRYGWDRRGACAKLDDAVTLMRATLR